MSNAWNPALDLLNVDENLINYGAGFLSCKPENWVPSIASLWAPLFNIVNLDLQTLVIEPTFNLPENIDHGWVGTFVQEPFGIACEKISAEYFSGLVVPNANSDVNLLVQEYLVRRFIKSVSSSWTGPRLSELKFDQNLSIHNLSPVAGIKMIINANGRQLTFWILIGNDLLKTIDGLWRRQTTSLNLRQITMHSYDLELCRVPVHIAEINSFIQSGAEIDLPNLDLNRLILSQENKAVALTKLIACNGKFALEVVSDSSEVNLAEAVEMSVVLGEMQLDSHQVLQLDQPSSYVPTGIDLGANVVLKVSGEVVGRGLLEKTAEGFYITVQ